MPVAAAVEAVAVGASGGDRDGCAGAGAGEGGVGFEASGAGDLADQFRGYERAHALLGEQLRRGLADQASEFVGQRCNRASELADTADQIAGDPHPDASISASQPAGDLLLSALAGQAPRLDLPFGPEVVQLPAQLVDQSGPGSDQPLPMHAQQADLELDAGQLRDGQCVGAFPQRGPGDGQRVDRIGLATLAHAAASPGHQRWRQPQHPLAVIDQEPLKRPGHVPAVLDHPHPLGAERTPPRQQLPEPIGDRPLGPISQPMTHRIDRHGRMRLLVRIDPDRHHMPVPSCRDEQKRTLADRSQLGRSHAPIRSRHPSKAAKGDSSLARQHISATTTTGVSPTPPRTIHHAPPQSNARQHDLTETTTHVSATVSCR